MDVNSCSCQQLEGVLTRKQAQKVVDERCAGPFSSWEDLQGRVGGLGPKKLARFARTLSKLMSSAHASCLCRPS